MQKPRKTAKRSVWKYITGKKGQNRIRVFDWPDQGESLWIDYREDGKRIRKPLGHSDKGRAVRQAEQIVAGIGKLDPVEVPAAQELRTLFEIYEREVTPQKGKSGRGHDKRTLPLFLRAFGAERRPETLNVRDWQSYIRRRQSGELASHYKQDEKGKNIPTPVRARVTEQDLKLLLAVLNWAERSRDDTHGGYLLERNPLRGLKLPKEESPKRPMFTAEQCVALRSAAAKHSPLAERAVMLAWFTGHRSSAIRQLRWSDIDLENCTIHWRAETDKSGYEHRNPLHPELVTFLKRERARVGAIGNAWLFPAPSDPAQAASRHYFAKRLWSKLREAAAIPEGKQYGWHSFRRAFANALRDLPLRDVKDLGGWKSEKTLVTMYLQPNEATQRTALSKLVAASNGQ